MNRTFRLAIVSLSLLSALSAEEWHVFTNSQGKKLEAKVLKLEGEIVTLERRSDGRPFVLGLKELSEADREWLEDGDEKKPASAGEKSGLVDVDLNKNLHPRGRQQINDTLKEILGRAVPAGIDEKAAKAVNSLNAYRYLCGVAYDVIPDSTMNEQAIEAAKACAAHGSLSHDLGKFTNICNLSQGPGLVETVESYINDSGANNREARGHRRWCLNPPMGKTGFGASNQFGAMVAMDSSGKGKARESWGYPGKGFFPLAFLHGDGWSLYLQEKAPKPDDLEVEVFRLAIRPSKPFTWADKMPGEVVKVGYVASVLNSINFEPEGANKAGAYWVRVRGGGVREQYLVELY